MSPTITKIFYFLLAPVLGKKIFQDFFEKLYLLSLAGMNYGQVIPKKSGEENIIKLAFLKLKNKKKIIIFDVGANKGEFTNLVLKIFKKSAVIYSVEPLKKAATLLKQKFWENPVKVYNVGFSNKEGKAFIYFDEDTSELASLYKRNYKGMSLPVVLNKKELIRLTTLDKFCLKQKIKVIDFLKIDAEGNEFKIFQGAKKMLSQNRINMIQFEFGGTMIDSRTFFRDIYQLLEEQYRIYRILQDGVREIKPYTEKSEIFIIGNFFAVNKKFKS